jgi:hypothetical protein
MSLTELLPELRSLPRSDKLRVIQLLAADLAEGEDPPVIPPGQAYPVWSPFDAYPAADTLLKALAAEGKAL